MTYTDAKEIVGKYDPTDYIAPRKGYSDELFMAKGYLEGSEQWKAIAERLAERLSYSHCNCEKHELPNYLSCPNNKVLADYEKLKGEK